MKLALVLLVACAKPQPPRIEHHAPPPQDETFVADAPLVAAAGTNRMLWKLTRHDTVATLSLAGQPAVGKFLETDGAIHVEVPTPTGEFTMDCHRGATRVHVASAQPQDRGEPAVCTTPRVWTPADTVEVAVLSCSVHDEQLVTQVTMAAPPGLQTSVDDCCDDSDHCEQRLEFRLLRTREELAVCDDCPCFEELIHRFADCKAPDVAQLILDSQAARIETPAAQHTGICRDYAGKLAAAARGCPQ